MTDAAMRIKRFLVMMDADDERISINHLQLQQVERRMHNFMQNA